ncbi:MAG: hypothetical protein QOJ27_2651 [Sphingomonadales bacterium]|nr:hypothetical protein [Sphingomonadales bacterium]
MRGLDAEKIIALSERGAHLPPARRAALLLAAAFPEAPESALLRLAVGTRDRLLMQLRARMFGDAVTAHQSCAACGEDFELDFTAGEVGLGPRREDEQLPEAPAATLDYRRRSFEVRAVCVADMIAAEAVDGIDAARELLAARAAPEAPAAARARVAEALERLDPVADVQLEAPCPHCGSVEELRLEPGSFVWEELAARAPRILRDVADLARAYHWSERDILAMPAARRAFYLAAA